MNARYQRAYPVDRELARSPEGPPHGVQIPAGAVPYYDDGNGWSTSVPSSACLRRSPRSARVDLRKRITQAAAHRCREKLNGRRVRWRLWERFTMALAASLAPAWQSAILLVQPATILRWHRAGLRAFLRSRSQSMRRPPTARAA